MAMIPTSRIFGFRNKYPQEFLDQLAKDLGFKWTKVDCKTIPKDLIEVKPMSPPSGLLTYVDYDYDHKAPNNSIKYDINEEFEIPPEL